MTRTRARCLLAMLAMLALSVPATGLASSAGWKLTRQADTPVAYAITAPASTNMNVKAVVLACELVSGFRVLQLQLYPTNMEPLLPRGASRDDMKEVPRVEIEVDGITFTVTLGPAGDYAVLQDDEQQGAAALSAAMAEVLEKGRWMKVRFDLVNEPAGQAPQFDGELEVDLTAGEGTAAIAAVRHECGA